MSTFAYRDGLFAADSRAYAGNPRFIGHKSKLFVFQDGTIVGCSTTQPGFAEAFADWVNAGANANPSETPILGEAGFEALVVRADGSVFYYNDGFYPSGPLAAEFYAIGSGAEYALGAMERGATAFEAVQIACKYDRWSAEPISQALLEPVAGTAAER